MKNSPDNNETTTTPDDGKDARYRATHAKFTAKVLENQRARLANADSTEEAGRKQASEIHRRHVAEVEQEARDRIPEHQRFTAGNIIPVLIAFAFVAWAMNSCKHLGENAPVRPPVDRTVIARTTHACPTKQALELMMQAGASGDGAVAATKLVNNCSMIGEGTQVEVVGGGIDYSQVRRRDGRGVVWVIDDLAFARR